ncbi:hypothetical protein [Pseudomonas sp. FP2254]|uniref:hypothetical protein n=1 Tax=Pseudomonas sp. FP2254 TaxID=2954087 RepID=UPI0027339148|nr:hypothetical protein [Pseudomonas sp. FP2254]WLH43248.1 hypothetical protein PSH94_11960 [Pseudomonas sp. FP2254]
MTTNQTIDGALVSLELIERILNRTRWHGDPLKDELRALLDAPACSACNDTGRMHEPGCEPGACTACLEKPATQPQGEPVAIVTGSTVQWLPGAGKIPDRSPLYAEQPAPVAVVPDGYCIMPRQLTAENGAKALLLGEFKLLVTKECPECCELEEPTEGCSICDGEGEYGQKHTIPWDQIKYIYSKAVSGLAVKTESAKSR